MIPIVEGQEVLLCEANIDKEKLKKVIEGIKENCSISFERLITISDIERFEIRNFNELLFLTLLCEVNIDKAKLGQLVNQIKKETSVSLVGLAEDVDAFEVEPLPLVDLISFDNLKKQDNAVSLNAQLRVYPRVIEDMKRFMLDSDKSDNLYKIYRNIAHKAVWYENPKTDPLSEPIYYLKDFEDSYMLYLTEIISQTRYQDLVREGCMTIAEMKKNSVTAKRLKLKLGQDNK